MPVCGFWSCWAGPGWVGVPEGLSITPGSGRPASGSAPGPLVWPPGPPPAAGSSGAGLTTAPATEKLQIWPPTSARTPTPSLTSMRVAPSAAASGVASTSSPISARVRRSMLFTATAMPAPTASPLLMPPAHSTLVCRLTASRLALRPVTMASDDSSARVSLCCSLYSTVPPTDTEPAAAPAWPRSMLKMASSAFMLKPPSLPL